MHFPDRVGIDGDRRRLPPTAPLSCDRGGPLHKIDEVLTELLDQYRVRFPELQVSVVHTPAMLGRLQSLERRGRRGCSESRRPRFGIEALSASEESAFLAG